MAGLLRHHPDFGYSRGRLRLLLSERQARLAAAGRPVPGGRPPPGAFVLGRVVRYRPARLPATLLLLLPLLFLGIAAWTVGFRRGLAAAPPGHGEE